MYSAIALTILVVKESDEQGRRNNKAFFFCVFFSVYKSHFWGGKRAFAGVIIAAAVFRFDAQGGERLTLQQAVLHAYPRTA